MVDEKSTCTHVTLSQTYAYLPTQLLSSPTFHRGVEKVHRSIRRIRRGPDMEDMGTKIESRYLYYQNETLNLNQIQSPTVAKSS